MPLYEYECDACGQRFELIRKFSDPAVEECARCGRGPVRRLFSSPAIQFKGSGWYITDYAKKSTTDAGSKSAAEAKPGDSAAPAAGSSSSGDTGSTPSPSQTTPAAKD